MKGLDFSKLAASTLDDPALDNAHSSDEEEGEDDAEEEDGDESDEGEMPIDTPAKPKKVPEVPAVKEPVREKIDVKAAVAKVQQGTGINAAPLGMPQGTGSLIKGKNGELVSQTFNLW